VRGGAVSSLRGPSGARALPWVLIAFRLAASPVLVADAADGNASALFLPLFLAAFLSDVLDGILARRLGVQTAVLRSADIALYGSVAASAWLVKRATVEPFVAPILVVIGLQILSWLIDLAKFRRLSSYHAWSAKAWGIAQAVAVVALFGFDRAGAWLWGAIALGALNNLECMAITLILPEWTHDVPSFAHALALRDRGLN
jgi:phosphatidylglycerophosphate synthase